MIKKRKMIRKKKKTMNKKYYFKVITKLLKISSNVSDKKIDKIIENTVEKIASLAEKKDISRRK